MPVRTLIPPNKDDWYDGPCKQSGCSRPPIPPPVPPPPPPPPPPPASSSDSHERATFVTGLIIAGSALVFVVICLSLFLLVRRRRQRRRREALLEAALAPAGPAAPADGGLDFEEAGGEIVHHAWHIRTVGLDEAAIESIALTRYRAGAGGVLGASDCAVCLGEFADGELLRLLPKCAHAFHVRCIDTWLRAHVNCPLCRSHVLDDPTPAPAAGAAEQFESPAATDVSDTGQAASSHATPEQGQTDRQASEQRELQLQMDQHDGLSTSPDQPHRHPGPHGRSFRRVASMDSPSQMASAQEAAPETDEQAGGAKQGTGRADHCELVLSPGCSDRVKNHRGMKRSLSVGGRWALVSRHCRRSSSLLPL